MKNLGLFLVLMALCTITFAGCGGAKKPETKPAVPTTPADEAPADEAPATDAAPAGETPAAPAGETPAAPAGETPAAPATDAPADAPK